MEIKKCCLFNKPEEDFKDNKDFSVIKKYGEIPAPNECTRSLLKCNKCGALFLYQFLEWNDSYYNDYIQVESEEQADKFNEELSFSKFNSNNPMIKIGSNKKVVFQILKDNSRAKQIIEALSNKDQVKLKELEVSNEEIESILKSIDNKIEKLDSEILEYINNVEKEINYTFVEDYKKYILNNSNLKLEKNILGLLNGNEKIIRHFYSMDPNSKTYILRFQNFDSELKNELIPFAELEFGDTLCFERESNKIVVYNHETDTTDAIASNWNQFLSGLSDDYDSKRKRKNNLKCPSCDGILAFLMPDGHTLYCNKCEKYYKNDNGNVGEETTSPYTRKDVMY